MSDEQQKKRMHDLDQPGTRDDVNAQARAHGTTPERVGKGKGRKSAEKPLPPDQQSGAAPGQLDSEQLEPGYRETLGDDYEQQAQHPDQAEESADPRRSGAQPAPNKPGKRIDSPGREGKNAWAERIQNSRSQR